MHTHATGYLVETKAEVYMSLSDTLLSIFNLQLDAWSGVCTVADLTEIKALQIEAMIPVFLLVMILMLYFGNYAAAGDTMFSNQLVSNYSATATALALLAYAS
jgi:hypothetical protein